MCLLQFLSTIDNEHSERKSNQVGKRCVEHKQSPPPAFQEDDKVVSVVKLIQIDPDIG